MCHNWSDYWNNFLYDIQNLNFANIYKTTDKYKCFEAHSYPLKAGGKRIRPKLVFLVAGTIAGFNAVKYSKNVAIAIELLHTYSLVHDDLPCMDNDDFRRGRLSTHKVYGEAEALLVGDGLLTLAFAQLNEYTNDKNDYDIFMIPLLTQILANNAGINGMILGQWLDISANKPNTWDELYYLQSNKTGKLIGACLAMGFVCGITDYYKHNDIPMQQLYSVDNNKIINNLIEIGLYIGIAFQILDDILDITSSQTKLGKSIGKDVKQGKITAISLFGLTKSQQMAEYYTDNAINKLKNIIKSFDLTIDNFFYTEIINFIMELLNRTH